MTLRRHASLIALAALAATGARGGDVKVDGYLEFRKPRYLIVDGQRVKVKDDTRIKGAKNGDAIPLGWEVEVEGTRKSDGKIVAREIVASENGMQPYEEKVLAGSDQAEQNWVKAHKIVEPGPDGKEVVLGALHDSGPQVDRARAIVDRLLPPYVDPKDVRVYVVDNPEWNAMAMANYSVYVFSGIMKDLDDDELAIVLGHEIAHATHEHSRRQAKKSTYSGIAGIAATVGAEFIDNDLARGAAQTATAVGAGAFGNYFSRDYEDQADRVGLRYVYEAGYDYKKAPKLWRRFAEKYGDGDKVTNFLFGDHSLSEKRADDLQSEIKHNYRDTADDPPSHAESAKR